MAAAVAPPPQAPAQAPVAQLWDELCAPPVPPVPSRVVIATATARLFELARAALSDEDLVEQTSPTVGCCAASPVEGAETWKVVGRPAVAAELTTQESAVGAALRAASHKAAIVVVDGNTTPGAALACWRAALDDTPTLVVAFGGSELGALRRRCGDAGLALAVLKECGDASMRETLRAAVQALLAGEAPPASRYEDGEAFYAPGEAALDAPDDTDGAEVAAPPPPASVVLDRDAWLSGLEARAGGSGAAPATPSAAAAAAAPTPDSNARSFFEGLLNSP